VTAGKDRKGKLLLLFADIFIRKT